MGQFGYGSGSGGMFTSLTETYQQKKREREVETAMAVMGGGAPEDNRTGLERLLSKQDWETPTKTQAMSTLYQYHPKAAQHFQQQEVMQQQAEQKRKQEAKERLNSFGQDLYGLGTNLLQFSEKDDKGRANFTTSAMSSLQERNQWAFEGGKMDPLKKMLADEAFTKQELDELIADSSPFGPARELGSEGDLDVQEVDRAWKWLAVAGENKWDESEFGKKTIQHMANRTQEQAMKRAALGNRVYNAEFSPFDDAKDKAGRMEFESSEVSALDFHDVADRIEATGEETPGAIGIAGWAARTVDEIKSAASNLSTMSFTNKKGQQERLFDPADLNMDEYNWEGIAYESAGMKSNLFAAALVYAGAIGLGSARALSDKDVQHSITTIGGGTNSLGQLKARLGEAKKTIVGHLENTAKVRSRRGGAIGEYYGSWQWTHQGRQPTATTVTTQEQYDALPSGAVYMEEDGQRYTKP